MKSSIPRYVERARAIWPRLDAEKLRRTHGDPRRIARLVSHRTALSVETVLLILLAVDALS